MNDDSHNVNRTFCDFAQTFVSKSQNFVRCFYFQKLKKVKKPHFFRK